MELLNAALADVSADLINFQASLGRHVATLIASAADVLLTEGHLRGGGNATAAPDHRSAR